ncbi:hypothetical protein, partial [Phaeobacter sp. B1627]|uniref:hypothetical protein n=1 Tax=Phaeobacter sp. B1627 TaxID=2583809 RepID=UPI001C40027A
FFIVNLLRYLAENILRLITAIFRGDCRRSRSENAHFQEIRPQMQSFGEKPISAGGGSMGDSAGYDAEKSYLHKQAATNSSSRS